ncbi:MAG: WYL domain-containing protein [Burkholderiaceae bacterium]|jgi:hypothetical protein|nr:WYL domain-containing protein [Burkholderiaceae bacterium]
MPSKESRRAVHAKPARPALAEALGRALCKVLGVLPPLMRNRVASLALHAPPAQLRRQRYRKRAHCPSLGCFYWGDSWTLGTWCELRADFRGFRMDRIAALHPLDAHFRNEPGRHARGLFASRQCGHDALARAIVLTRSSLLTYQNRAG